MFDLHIEKLQLEHNHTKTNQTIIQENTQIQIQPETNTTEKQNKYGSKILYMTSRKNNMYITIEEKDINDMDSQTSKHSSQSTSTSTSSSYYDIREELHNKFTFKRTLRNRTYDDHIQYIKKQYSPIEKQQIMNFYEIKPNYMYVSKSHNRNRSYSSNSSVSSKESVGNDEYEESFINDEIVRYELDFTNFEKVWERYQLWENIYKVRKYSHIAKELL